MNLKELFDQQLKLDQLIESTHGVQGGDIFNKKIMALVVEIAEFANEISFFKYWKKNITYNRKNILEEYVDGIHFLISMALKLKIDPNIDIIVKNDDPTEHSLDLFEQIALLRKDRDPKVFKKIFGMFLGYINIFKWTEKEVIDMYFYKNKINFQRVANNY